jgi:S1-C subfamily serine protease
MLRVFLLLAAALALAALGAGPDAGEAWLGVLLGEAVDGGVQILAVVPGGPAQAGGLRGGDVLVQAGAHTVVDLPGLEGVLASLRPGQPLAVQVLRGGRAVDAVIALGRRGTVAVAPSLPPPPRPPEPCGSLGLCAAELTPDLRRHFGAPAGAGLLVTAVGPDSPAARAGVQVGDVVVDLGERALRRVEDLDVAAGGGERTARIVRDGRPLGLTLHGPEAAAAAAIREEIRRLERRIRELEQQLARLEPVP